MGSYGAIGNFSGEYFPRSGYVSEAAYFQRGSEKFVWIDGGIKAGGGVGNDVFIWDIVREEFGLIYGDPNITVINVLSVINSSFSGVLTSAYDRF